MRQRLWKGVNIRYDRDIIMFNLINYDSIHAQAQGGENIFMPVIDHDKAIGRVTIELNQFAVSFRLGFGYIIHIFNREYSGEVGMNPQGFQYTTNIGA